MFRSTFCRAAAGVALSVALAACTGPAATGRASASAVPARVDRTAVDSSNSETEVHKLLRELARMRSERNDALAQLHAALRGERVLEARLAKPSPSPAPPRPAGSPRTQVFTTLSTAAQP